MSRFEHEKNPNVEPPSRSFGWIQMDLETKKIIEASCPRGFVVKDVFVSDEPDPDFIQREIAITNIYAGLFKRTLDRKFLTLRRNGAVMVTSPFIIAITNLTLDDGAQKQEVNSIIIARNVYASPNEVSSTQAAVFGLTNNRLLSHGQKPFPPLPSQGFPVL